MINSLLQAIPLIMQLSGGVQGAKAGIRGRNIKPQKLLADEMTTLARAQGNPDSAQFQNIYQKNRQYGQQNLADTIAEISRQNRKLTTMGRSPLLDRERGGESIFRNLIKGQQDVDNQAFSDTFGQLGTAQKALTTPYNAYGDISDIDFENKLRKASTTTSIGDSLKNLFGL